MRITNATREDKGKLLDFLDMRGLAENVWLAWSISCALHSDGDFWRTLICEDKGRIAGVACISWGPGGPAEHCQIRLDAEDQDALLMLVDAFPKSQSQRVSILKSEVQLYMNGVHGFQRKDGDPYFTVNSEQFKPIISGLGKIVQVTEDMRHLFDGCESQPEWEYLAPETQIDACVVGDRVVSSVSTSQLTPVLSSGRQAVSVGALYTQTEFRRGGYARELVSHVTQRILSAGCLPIYWTEQENTASQALCKTLGYRQYSLEALYYH